MSAIIAVVSTPCTSRRAAATWSACGARSCGRASRRQGCTRVVNLLRAPSRYEVLDVEENVQARADLAAALLDQLADVLPDAPARRATER
eukprot:1099870-Prymnesium_polylepis.1